MRDDAETLDAIAGQALVAVARRSLDQFVAERTLYEPVLAELPSVLHRPGSTFVTLTDHGCLRGCLGSMEARWSLAEDVARNAVAASRDPRFAPVTAAEAPDIRLEVTVLTPPRLLAYMDYDDLLQKLKPGIDGVVLTWGAKRGLLLPQVWHRIPDPFRFLETIADKAQIPKQNLAAAPPTIVVHTFQAQRFREEGYCEPGRSTPTHDQM